MYILYVRVGLTNVLRVYKLSLCTMHVQFFDI